MRMLVVVSVSLLGCGGSSGDGPDAGDGEVCPATLTEGAACSFAGRCWQTNNFSSCLSAWCTCESGHVVCDALAPRTGDACGDEPITSCSYEGNPTCDTAPTSEYCSCADDGCWYCTCACYGGESTCGACPDGLPVDKVEGLACDAAGDTCSYPTATCTCTTEGDRTIFRCTP